MQGSSQAPVPTTGFVGRTAELARLHRAVDDVVAGRGRILMLVGEPGIGKSRTAEELAGLALARGAQVLNGRCHEGGAAPPFWPWRQIVRTHVQRSERAQLLEDLGPDAPEVARIAEELRRVFPDLPRSEPGDAADDARFRQFDALARFLGQVARRRPLVLILDDLHWADPSSLMLLQFVARDTLEAPILICGTYREVEIQRDTVRANLLASLSRERAYERIALSGLSEAESRLLLERDLGTAASSELVLALVERTEGNPFFLQEMVRHMRERGLLDRGEGARVAESAPSVPHSVRAVIEQRLQRLADSTRHSLELAAVVGRDFELAVVAALEDSTTATILTRLAEAAAAGLLQPLPRAATSGRFIHALVRDVLYDGLPADERAALHRRVGLALESHWQHEVDEHIAELAHHFHLAASLGDTDRALRYCVLAAHRADMHLAYEDAIEAYQRALEIAGFDANVDAETRCRLLLGLGAAEAASADVQRMRVTFRRAADIARSLENPEYLARAALGYARAPALGGNVDTPAVTLLEEALQRMPTTDSGLRAALLSILADALHHEPSSYERRLELCTEASAMARRVADWHTLARTIYDRHNALFGPDSLDDRIATSEELLQLAQRTGDRAMLLRARFWRVVNHFEAGEVAVAVAETDALESLAHELREPWHHWYALWLRAAHALMTGRFEEGERLAHEAYGHGERVARDNALQALGAQIAMLRALQGRWSEMLPAIRDLLEQFPAMAAWRCSLAYHYAELGETSEARQHFEILARDEFVSIPRDGSWMAAISQLVDVCCTLADRERAVFLYDMLAPFANRLAVIDRALACSGVGHRYLGVLATLMQRWSDAERHLDEALTFHRRSGMRPWVALTQLDRAALLVDHPTPAPQAAAEALAEAIALASELGMEGLLAKATQLRTRVESAATQSAPTSPLPPVSVASPTIDTATHVFLKEGDYWTVSFGGTTHRFKDMLGLQYLAYLLRHPGRSFHVTELVQLVGGAETKNTRVDDGELSVGRRSDAAPTLDQRARAAYRQRVSELQEELAEARENNDPGAAERAENEMDALMRELTGIARGSTSGERARVSVTKRLKAALTRIRESQPDLARHLDATVKSGYFCSYNPDERLPIEWRT